MNPNLPLPALNIAIAGTGYVGRSPTMLLAERHALKVLDVMASKVELINAKQSPIQDAELAHYLACKPLLLLWTKRRRMQRQTFKQQADLFVVNRRSVELANVAHKVYTRDLSQSD